MLWIREIFGFREFGSVGAWVSYNLGRNHLLDRRNLDFGAHELLKRVPSRRLSPNRLRPSTEIFLGLIVLQCAPWDDTFFCSVPNPSTARQSGAHAFSALRHGCLRSGWYPFSRFKRHPRWKKYFRASFHSTRATTCRRSEIQ